MKAFTTVYFVLCAVETVSCYKMQITFGLQSVNISAHVHIYIKGNAAHSVSILGSTDVPFQMSLHPQHGASAEITDTPISVHLISFSPFLPLFFASPPL
jgi:hypothetical protein